MMPGFAHTAAFILALSLAGGAPAQTTPATVPAGTPRFEAPRPRDTVRFRSFDLSRFSQANLAYADTYQRMISYGRCATNVAPKYAGRFLSSEPGDPQGIAAARRLVGLSKGCLPLGSYVPMNYLRVGLAEAGYRRALATGTPLPRPTLVSTQTYDKTSFAAAATCLASRAPDATHTVMSTTPGSAAERDALIQAFAATPQCGRIGKATLRELPDLRAYIAFAAYRSLMQS